MLKKTFYLFSVSLLFFGATSCDKGCDMKYPLEWYNTHTIYIGDLKLRVNDYFYVVNSGKMPTFTVLTPDKPITNFYDLYDLPLFPLVTQNSNVKVTTAVNYQCLATDDDRLNAEMDQIYYTYGWNPLSSTPNRPSAYSYSSIGMGIWGAGGSYDGSFDYWQSTRGDFSHTYTLVMRSGPYERGGAYGTERFDLVWTWHGNENTINKNNLKIDNNGTATLSSMNVMGAPVNVTPNKPFIQRVYIAGAMVERTLENVVMPNNMMSLQVTLK